MLNRRHLVAAAILYGANTSMGAAQEVSESLWETNGIVRTIAAALGRVYLSGDFDYVGPSTGAAVPIDAATGKLVGSFPRVVGTVTAVAPDGEGGWYIGGIFGRVGGEIRVNLAHVLADFSVSDWDPRPDSWVNAIVVGDSTVYVGGAFLNVGGQQRIRLASFDKRSGALTPWNPRAGGETYSAVDALALSGDTVYAGGSFIAMGGSSRRRVAAVDAETGTVREWNPNASNTVYALAVRGGTVYAGGSFLVIGGQERNFIAALNATTGAATPWNPNGIGDHGWVNAILLGEQTAYVGGEFQFIGGQPRPNIAELNLASGLATSWSPAANSTVIALAKSGGAIYAAGRFTTIGGQERRKLAQISTASGTVSPWNPTCAADVLAMALEGDVICAGGSFSSVGGKIRRKVAAIDEATGEVTAFDPGSNGIVRAFAVSGSTLFAGGGFTTFGGVARSRLAAVDAETGAIRDWDPAPDGTVWGLGVKGSTVYVGGDFQSIGGEARGRIAAVDVVTGAPSAWNPNANRTVRALAVGDDLLYVGGYFTSLGGEARNRIAAIDLATGAATAWDPNGSSSVVALVLAGPVIYAGGDFGSIGGATRGRIAAIDRVSGAATAWNPVADGPVTALAAKGPGVYVGGNFGTIGGLSRDCVAAIDATTGLATAWDADLSNGDSQSVSVGALAISAKVYVGGFFDRVGSSGSAYLAGLGYDSPPVSVPREERSIGAPLVASPNPFRFDTRVGFSLPEGRRVHVQVFDISGRLVRVLLHGDVPGGPQSLPWDGRGRGGEAVGPGVYFVRLEACGETETAKIVKLSP